MIFLFFSLGDPVKSSHQTGKAKDRKHKQERKYKGSHCARMQEIGKGITHSVQVGRKQPENCLPGPVHDHGKACADDRRSSDSVGKSLHCHLLPGCLTQYKKPPAFLNQCHCDQTAKNGRHKRKISAKGPLRENAQNQFYHKQTARFHKESRNRHSRPQEKQLQQGSHRSLSERSRTQNHKKNERERQICRYQQYSQIHFYSYNLLCPGKDQPYQAYFFF